MKTKICAKCKVVKSLSDFNKNKSRKDGYHHHCRECAKQYHKQWYDNGNKKYFQVKHKAKRLEIKQYLDDLKLNEGCKYCGYKKHTAALHFHHRDQSEKVFNIGNYMHTTLSMDRVIQEVKKCDIVCANCHAEHTWKN